MVGQLQLPETPLLEVLYEEPGSMLFLIRDEEGELSLSAHVEGEITHNRLKHFDEIFISVIAGLIEQGLENITAWVPMNEGNLNFARYFGFEDLQSIKAIRLNNGRKKIFREMIYIFPTNRIENETNS